MTVIDHLQGAGAGIPERTIAGHTRLVIAQLHGITPEGNLFITHLGPVARLGREIVGGRRLRHVCINDGDTHKHASEQVEAKFPLLIGAMSYGATAAARLRRGGLGRLCRDGVARCSSTPASSANSAAWGFMTARRRRQFDRAARRRPMAGQSPNAKLMAQRLEKGDAL